MQLGSSSAPEAARTYPLSLLEWITIRRKANMVLHVHCFDGEMHHIRFKHHIRKLLILLQLTNIHIIYCFNFFYVQTVQI